MGNLNFVSDGSLQYYDMATRAFSEIRKGLGGTVFTLGNCSFQPATIEFVSGDGLEVAVRLDHMHLCRADNLRVTDIDETGYYLAKMPTPDDQVWMTEENESGERIEFRYSKMAGRFVEKGRSSRNLDTRFFEVGERKAFDADLRHPDEGPIKYFDDYLDGKLDDVREYD